MNGIYGRHNPSGTYRGGLQSKEQWLNRVHIGQIVSVASETGIATVRMLTSQREHQCVIPLGGLAVKGSKSSWMRYMPQDAELVKVEYGLNDLPEIVGYATWGDYHDDKTGRAMYGNGGYAAIDAAAQRRAGGLGVFRRLRKGEWDMRSKGGAEIYGTDRGRLLMSGGASTSVDLVKQRNEANVTSDLSRLKSNSGTELRVGKVKRFVPDPITTLLPTNEVDVSLGTVPFAAEEYRLRVRGLLNPTGEPTVTYYTAEAGDLRDDQGALLTGDNVSGNLRYRAQVHDVTGLLGPVVSVEVNEAGDIDIRQQARPPLTAPSALSVTGTGTVTITATETATLDGAEVKLGASATEAAVLGNALKTFLENLTVPTALGPSGPPLNIGTVSTILSGLVKVGS